MKQPRQLQDEDGDNLNRIAIFMRGKMAQEDILDEFGQKEIYADYVIGELHCDDLDDDAAGRHRNQQSPIDQGRRPSITKQCAI